MRHRLTGMGARDRGTVELCTEVAPPGHRVVVAHEAMTSEELDERLAVDERHRRGDLPLWVYGSTLPGKLFPRSTKIQVHESFVEFEAPWWFDHGFARSICASTIPGFSCFSRESLHLAARQMLEDFRSVRLKDPNSASGEGQWVVDCSEGLTAMFDDIEADLRETHDAGMNEYLAEFGFLVEANLVDVQAWSVTVTTTPRGRYSSFGRLLEVDITTPGGVGVRKYGGTSSVSVRGGPESLLDLPRGGVDVVDPVVAGECLRLRPTPEMVGVARRHIDGMRRWECEGVIKTRANVDVITGALVLRDGSRRCVTASVEDSGRAGGASPAELLGITELQRNAELPYAVRSSRHSLGSSARIHADHAAGVPGSRVFWDAADPAWADERVFIGVF